MVATAQVIAQALRRLALARIEEELQLPERSNLIEWALETMRAQPGDWSVYHRGSQREVELALKYTLEIFSLVRLRQRVSKNFQVKNAFFAQFSVKKLKMYEIRRNE